MPPLSKALTPLQSTIKQLLKLHHRRVGERVQIVSPDLCGKTIPVRQTLLM